MHTIQYEGNLSAASAITHLLDHLSQRCPTGASGPPGVSIRPAKSPQFCQNLIRACRCNTTIRFASCQLNICHRSVKNDRFVAIRCVISSSKNIKHVFPQGSAPDPAGGAYNTPPDTLVGWEGVQPLPLPFPLDAEPWSRHLWRLGCQPPNTNSWLCLWIRPATSIKFVHLALRSKRLDTPDLSSKVICKVAVFLTRRNFSRCLFWRQQ